MKNLPRVIDGEYEEYTPTQYHPNYIGYWIIAAAIFAAIYMAFGWVGVLVAIVMWLLM